MECLAQVPLAVTEKKFRFEASKCFLNIQNWRYRYLTLQLAIWLRDVVM